MMQRRISMLVSNACAPDRRVLREAEALVEAGHYVLVIAWDRGGNYPPYEVMGDVPIQRIKIPAAYGAGLRRLRQWPTFARRAFDRLGEESWDVVHCHDLDTLPIGYAYARRRNTRLVFDAHESYPDFAAPRLPGWATWGLRRLERYLVKRVDALITVGELLAEHYRQCIDCNVVVVRNCPPVGDLGTSSDLSRRRVDWGLDDVALVIAYVGGFTHGRVILPLLTVVRDDPTLGMVLVGSGPQQSQIEAIAADIERIVYLGPRIPPEQVVPTMRAADAVYYGLRADHPNNHYSSPNALYSALAAGRPLLTTGIGEISVIVKREACGVVLEEPSPEAIHSALDCLRDPDRRAKMSCHARQAAERHYNWSVAKKRLLSLYETLWEEV